MSRNQGWGVALVTALVVAGALAAAHQQQAPARGAWYGPDAKGRYQAYQDAGGRFVLEYPQRDWMLLGGDGNVLLVATQKSGEAWIILERARMNTSLAPDEVTDLFADLEMETVKQGQPRADGFEKRVFATDNRRFVAVQYSRPSLDQREGETVRQVLVPAGSGPLSSGVRGADATVRSLRKRLRALRRDLQTGDEPVVRGAESRRRVNRRVVPQVNRAVRRGRRFVRRRRGRGSIRSTGGRR